MESNQWGEIANTGAQSLVRGLFDASANLISPLSQRLIDQPVSDRESLNETIDYNRLNGSGPVDPTGAARAPQNLDQFLFGQPAGAVAPTSSGGFNMNTMLLPLLAVVVVLVLILRK